MVIQDWENNEFWALLQLDAFADHFLYVSREVDGKILGLLDETQETVRLYQQLEADRGRLLFEFALIYLGFALVVILAAMWMGLWFAERLARPVGRLAGAAERVGAGRPRRPGARGRSGDDEIALLGRTFNEMTRQVKGQRDALIAANAETERRRRLFELGAVGRHRRRDRPRRRGAHRDDERRRRGAARPRPRGRRRPAARRGGAGVRRPARTGSTRARPASRRPRCGCGARRASATCWRASRRAAPTTATSRATSSPSTTSPTSCVAQRMAAWGDVARRIAHEVKNPLTPIQLSAERLRRKFGPMVGEERATLEQYADVIVRQTNDLRRIVDEFSKFARMPAPERRPLDLGKLVTEAVVLQEIGAARTSATG